MKRKQKQTWPAWSHAYAKLAVYNAERNRGIVHTPEWDERMAKIQARFDRETADGARMQAEDHANHRRVMIGLPVELPHLGDHESGT